MKKFFAAVVCCALMIANTFAQEGASVVEESAKVVLASAQEPAPEAQSSAADVAAPAAQAPVAPVAEPAPGQSVETAPAQVVEGVPMHVAPAAPVYGNSGCGCGSSVISYAAPMAAPAAPVAGDCCQAAAPSCCPTADCNNGRGRNFSRPYVIRNLRGRMTSMGRNNNCCCN